MSKPEDGPPSKPKHVAMFY